MPPYNQYQIQSQIDLYRSNPLLFSEDRLDELERVAKAEGIRFNRDMSVSSGNIGSTLNQLVSGVVEGFTTLGWADDPRTTGEALAGRIGHLIGFAPDVILGVLAMLEPTPFGEAGYAAYLTGKYGGKTAAKVGAGAAKARKRLDPLVKGETVAQKAGKKRLEKLLGRELKESPFRLKSIPFRVAEATMDIGARTMGQAGFDAAKFMAKHPAIGAISEEAIRLGLASGVSAWREGPGAIAESTLHGAVAGAVFGSTANFVRFDKMLNHPNPMVMGRGMKALETLTKASIGAGFMGGMTSLADEPMPVVVYETLLGAFFGGGAKPAWEKLANKHFMKMNTTGKLIDKFDPSRTDGYDLLPSESKAWIDSRVSEHMGQLFEYHTSEKGRDTEEKRVVSDSFLAIVASAVDKGIIELNRTDASSPESVSAIKREAKGTTLTTELDKIETVGVSGSLFEKKKADMKPSTLEEIERQFEGVEGFKLKDSKDVLEHDKAEYDAFIKDPIKWLKKDIAKEEDALARGVYKPKSSEEYDVTDFVIEYIAENKAILRELEVKAPAKAEAPVEESKVMAIGRVEKEIDTLSKMKGVTITRARSIPGKENRIGDIKVDPKLQRTGIGTRIVDAFKELKSLQGREKIEIEANAGSEAFWEAQGFKFVAETREGYPIDAKKYTGTQRPPKEPMYGRYQYEFDLKNWKPKVESKVEVSIENELIPKGTATTEEIDKGAREPGDDVVVRRNVIDSMIDKIQDVTEDISPYTHSKVAIQNELDALRRETLKEGGNVDDFLKKLSDYAPDADRPEGFEKNLRVYFKRLESTTNRPIFNWSKVDGFSLISTRAPDTEANKFFGEKTEITLTKMLEKIAYFDKDKAGLPVGTPNYFEIEVSPFDIKKTYQRSDGTWVKNEPYMKPKDWLEMEKQLTKEGYYIFSGANNNGILVARKMHSGVERNPLSKFTEELSAVDPDYFNVYDKALNEEMRRLGVLVRGKASTRVKKDFDRKIASNILYLMQENQSSLTEAIGLFKNVIDFNKRQSLGRGTEYPLRAEDVQQHLNADGKLSYIIIAEKSKSKNEADTDGGIQTHPKLMDDILEAHGMDKGSGFLKPVSYIHSVKEGIEIDKPGMHRASESFTEFMDKIGVTQVKYDTAVKVKGKRKLTKIRFNEKTGKWQLVGKKNVYTMNPEELKINTNVTDSKRKNTGPRKMFKPMFTKLIEEQMPEVDGVSPLRTMIDEVTKPAIEGLPGANKRVTEWLDGTVEYKPGDIGFKRGAINLDDIGTAQIFDIILSNPTSETTRDVLKFIFKRQEEAYRNQSGRNEEYGEEMEIDNAQTLTIKDVLEEGNYDFSVWSDPKIEPGVTKSLGNYIINRAFKPKWKDSSYMRIIDNTEEYRKRYNVESGEYMLQANHKDKVIMFQGAKTTKGEAWDAYLKALKRKDSPETLEKMRNDLGLFGGRVPVSGASGIRNLEFMGFLKEKGWGILLNKEDKYLFGGADNDADAVHAFGSMPDVIRRAFDMAKDELVGADGKPLHLKNPKLLKKYFGVDETSDAYKLYSSKSSMFMPSMRLVVAEGSYHGNRAVGTVTSSSQMMQVLLSTVIKNGGKFELIKEISKGKTARIELEYNDDIIPEMPNFKEKVPGDMFRYFVFNAQNNTLDATLPMHSAKKIRQMLFDRAFKSKYTIEEIDPLTKKIVKTVRKGGAKWNDLYGTSFGSLMELNNKLFGYNYSNHRAWLLEDQLRAISDVNNLAGEYSGFFPMAAREFGSYNFSLDLSNVVDVVKVRQALNRQNKRGDFAPGSEFLKLAGREKLSIAGSSNYNDTTLLLNDFHDWIVTRDIIVPVGKKIRTALEEKGIVDIDVYDLLGTIAEKATDFKSEGALSSGKARNTADTQSEMRVLLDRKIDDYRRTLTDTAEAMEINKKLLVSYFDAYMLGPLKYQNPAEYKAYHEEMFGEGGLMEIRDRLRSGLEHDDIGLNELEHQIKGAVKEMNMTSRQSVGWTSQVIPKNQKKNYRKVVGKALKKYYIDEYKVEVDEEVFKPQTKSSEPDPTIEAEDSLISGQELMIQDLSINYDAIYKKRDALGKLTDSQSILVEEFTDYMKKYPQFANEIDRVIPGITGEVEIVGRRAEHMTWDDVKMFLRMFRQMDKFKKEDLPVKWKHNYLFYSRLDEIMTPNDMRLIESADPRPVISSDGTVKMAKTKVPMSMFGIIQETASQAYAHDNKFAELWLQKKDEMFSYLSTVEESAKIVDWAVRSLEKNGDNRSYSDQWSETESKNIYKRRWKEVSKDFEDMQKKGEIHEIVENGKRVKIDTFSLMVRVQKSMSDFFKEFGDFLIYKEYKESDVIDGDGRLRKKYVRRVLSSIIGEVPFADVNIEGNAAINRLMYELDLQDLVKIKKFKSASEEKEFLLQYRKDNPPPTHESGTGGVGRISPSWYFHHTGFNDTKYSRENNSKAMEGFLERYHQAVVKGKVKVPKYLQVKVDNGEITKKEALEHMVYLKRQGYDKMKMGDLSGDMLLGEKTVEWLTTRSVTEEDLHKVRMKSQASASFSRGDIPLPEYRTDLGVLDDYVKSWSRSYFNNLVAMRARIGIDSFIQRGRLTSRRGGHDIGPEQTQNWANMMLEMTKRIIGYPTFFSEAIYGITPKKGRVIKKYLDGAKLSPKQQAVIDETKEELMNRRKAEHGPKAFSKLSASDIDKNDRLRMQKMLDTDVNKLGAYRTGYYLYSDEAAVRFLDKASIKLLNGKMPFYGELPKDPKTRKQVLSRMVHKFGVLEGKYSLISLLSHFKTSVGNIIGGSENIISSTGIRHYKNALNTKYLLDNVFQNATFKVPSADPWERIKGKRVVKFETVKIKTKKDIGDWLESIGVIDNYMKTEIGLDPTWRPDKNKKFIKAVISKISSMRRLNPNLTDKEARLTVIELGKEHGVIDALVDKGAAFMQRSEIWLRRNAFLAHYLNAYEALRPVSEELPWDSPVLIHFGKKGVEATQFMYHAAFRTNYSNTALGKVMTRFQPFAWNSLRFRRHIYQSAKMYGFKPGTKAFQKYQRTMTTDMMALALGMMFMGSIFDYAMPPPMSWMVDTSQWLFGDERDRERAFFSQWPTTALAPLQPVTAPITRFPLNILATIIDGNFDKFSSFYVHTWYPFGRLIRDVGRTIYNPSMIVENMTGLPLHRFQRKSTAYWKNALGIEEGE